MAQSCQLPEPSRFGARADALALLFALLFPTLATWIYFVALSGTPLMQPLYTVLKFIQFAFPVVWLWKRCSLATMFSSTRSGIVSGLAFGAVTAAAIVIVYHSFLKSSPGFAQFPARLSEKLDGFGANTIARYIALGAFISLAHSFLEEYYWRWFVHGQFRRRMRFVLAMVISSLGFMAHHVLMLGA